MATVFYQAPLGTSIGLIGSDGFFWRIRPTEIFALNTADSAQTDAFIEAGFDYTEHDPYITTDWSVVDFDKKHAHNTHNIVVDPP